MFGLMAVSGGISFAAMIITALLIPIIVVLKTTTNMAFWSFSRWYTQRERQRAYAIFDLWKAEIIRDPREDKVAEARQHIIEIFGDMERAERWHRKHISDSWMNRIILDAENESLQLAARFKAAEPNPYPDYVPFGGLPEKSRNALR